MASRGGRDGLCPLSMQSLPSTTRRSHRRHTAKGGYQMEKPPELPGQGLANKQWKRKYERANEVRGIDSCSCSEKRAVLSSFGCCLTSSRPPPQPRVWLCFKHPRCQGNRGGNTTLQKFLLEFWPNEFAMKCPSALMGPGFRTQSPLDGPATVGIAEISLCFRSPLCCVPYKHEALLLLCKAHKSLEQTLRKLGSKHTVYTVPARISAPVSPPSREGRRTRGLFASWHHSILYQSLEGCC